MDCYVKKVQQQSDEWFDDRRCRMTASRLHTMMSKPSTKGYQELQRHIAQELNGFEPVEEDAPWFAHGKEQEPRALTKYAFDHNINIEHNVFLIHKEYDWLGGSPDLLEMPIRDKPDFYDAGGEIKCRALYKTYLKFVHLAEEMSVKNPLKAVPSESRHQVQGCMWLTGFESWKFINYYEGQDFDGYDRRELHVVEIPRDQDLIDKMELRGLAFMHECYEIAGIAA